MTARTADDGFFISLGDGPNCGFVINRLAVAIETRKPITTAFEFDRDDIEFAVPMSAARCCIDINAVDFNSVDVSDHLFR
jgi:hypothetical protein